MMAVYRQVAASLLMVLTGLGFAAFVDFWPLLVIAFVGTLNPSSGDVSVFLPLEHALLAGGVAGHERPRKLRVHGGDGSVDVGVGRASGAARVRAGARNDRGHQQ